MAETAINQILADRVNAKGSLFPCTSQDIKRGRKAKKSLQDVLPTSEVCLDDIEEQSRLVEGVHDVAGGLFDRIYGRLLPSDRDHALLKDVVMARLVSPGSKREAQRMLDRRFGKTHQLDRIYRLMDKLFPRIDAIKQCTFQQTHSLFPQSVECILFDVTTLYFESTDTDELRRFGYSKDHHFNTTQVVLAMVAAARS